MFLKEVIIDGFKSFADTTQVALGRGITTIVGPNGCGKSNIVDAIRWVLGEQSAKALRGGKMNDVIFAGTDARKPASFASVTLIFADCEHALGTQFNEVAIQRKVSQEGQSNYSLNGRNCRLKDIQMLFMDTGIGRLSYSFMVQGQIDQIISSNPDERRTIFEEAAGITKYKSQLRESQSKLQEVDQNLLRLTDIVTEVEKQQASLKRQARKTLKYNLLTFQKRHLDLALSAYAFSELQQSITQSQNEQAEANKTLETLHTKVELEERRLKELRRDRNIHFESIQNKQQNLYHLRSQEDQLKHALQIAGVREKDFTEQITRAQNQLKELSEAATELDGRHALDLSQKATLEANLVQAAERFQGLEQKSKEANQAQAKLQQDLNEGKAQLRKEQQALYQLEQSLRQSERQLETLQTEQAAYQLHQNQAKERHTQLETQATALSSELETINGTLAQAETEFNNLNEARLSKRTGLQSLKESAQAAQRALDQADARLCALKSLKDNFEGYSDAAKSLLKGKLALPDLKLTPLLDGILVPDAYQAPFQSLFNAVVPNVYLGEMGQLSGFLEAFKQQKLGNLDLATPLTAGHHANGSAPEGAQAVVALLNFSAPQLQATWERLLQGCYYVESLEQAQAIIKDNPQFAFQTIVTQEGVLLDARGVLTVSSKKPSGNSLLAREQEIHKLTQEHHSLQEAKSDAQEALAQEEAALTKLDEALQAAQYLVQKSRAERAGLDAQLKRAQTDLSRADADLNQARQKFEQSETKQKALAETLLAENEKLAPQRKTLVELEASVPQLETHFSESQQQVQTSLQALNEAKWELNDHKQKLQNLQQALLGHEREKEAKMRRRNELNQEIETVQDRLKQLGEERTHNLEESSRVTQQAQNERTALAELETQATTLEKGLIAAEDAFSSLHKEVHAQESKLKTVEIRLTERLSERNHALDRIANDYQVDLALIDWQKSLWVSQEPLIDKGTLEEALETGEFHLKSERIDQPLPVEFDPFSDGQTLGSYKEQFEQSQEDLEKLGSVNTEALEEYGQLKARASFLQTQMDDLVTSKKQLEEAIAELNHLSESRFTETFNTVSQNFRFTFDSLFGGGEADLKLVDPENPLHSGIDITARPPGTKLRHLSLLSGGQKTMTAVALLFAIYKVKPSPFCVLDELDAPLDDANIGRFVTLVKEFTRYSQFLVISHNKRTISASDALYGVTMQEKGVTKLVSVKFEDKESSQPEESSVTAEASLEFAPA